VGKIRAGAFEGERVEKERARGMKERGRETKRDR